MDYKKAQKDYKFKRFGKIGALYKVFGNQEGDKTKILIIKNVTQSANNALEDLVGFSVVNFDQIETKNNRRTNEPISRLKKGETVKRIEIRIGKSNFKDVFDKLKKVKFDIENKDFEYGKDERGNVKKFDYDLVRNIIPKNFLSYDTNPSEIEEEGPQEIPKPKDDDASTKSKRQGSSFGRDEDDDDDDDDADVDSKGYIKIRKENPDIIFTSKSKDGTIIITRIIPELLSKSLSKNEINPNNSNNSKSPDSLLKMIVKAEKNSNGKLTLEDIGEIQDLDGEITDLYSQLLSIKSDINEAEKKGDTSKSDKLKVKYNKKREELNKCISRYSKELYKLSEAKKKTKATFASHKYLMNKLNKL